MAENIKNIDEIAEEYGVLINNILLRRLPVPKNVALPNSRTFYAKYVRVSRGNLPPKVRVAGTYI